MPVIRPVSDLRNNFKQLSTILHAEDEPIFLTKNGVGDLVVMSMEHYERHMARMSLYQKLEVAEKEISSGAVGKDAFTVLASLKRNPS